MKTTQENRRAPGYRERQRRVQLNGKTVWADPVLIPLLKALNRVGLVTRSHCAGHGRAKHAWVAIRLTRVTNVEVRMDPPYRELLLTWRRRR